MAAHQYRDMQGFPFDGHSIVAGLRHRIVVSIGALAGWLSLTLLYLAFFAQRFSLLQDIVILVVGLLVLAAVLAGSWITYGMRFIDDWWD